MLTEPCPSFYEWAPRVDSWPLERARRNDRVPRVPMVQPRKLGERRGTHRAVAACCNQRRRSRPMRSARTLASTRERHGSPVSTTRSCLDTSAGISFIQPVDCAGNDDAVRSSTAGRKWKRALARTQFYALGFSVDGQDESHGCRTRQPRAFDRGDPSLGLLEARSFPKSI